MTAVLRLEGVSRSFGGLTAVKSVTLDVEPGARLAIIGPNGAGKTTLFNLVSGELLPTSGRIRAFGRDVTLVAPHRRAALGIGRTYQQSNLFSRLTVLENMVLAVQAVETTKYVALRPLHTFTHLHDRARTQLESLGLWDLRGVPVSSLSYGDQRALEIAMALGTRPRLLLLDEPTAGLAQAETQAVQRIIRELPREITVLLIEHDMSVVFGVCEHILVLNYGEVIMAGPAERVALDARVREIYLGVRA